MTANQPHKEGEGTSKQMLTFYRSISFFYFLKYSVAFLSRLFVTCSFLDWLSGSAFSALLKCPVFLFFACFVCLFVCFFIGKICQDCGDQSTCHMSSVMLER